MLSGFRPTVTCTFSYCSGDFRVGHRIRNNFKHLVSFCLTLHYYNLSTVFEGFKTEDKSKTFMILTEACISSYTAATGKLNFDIRVTE